MKCAVRALLIASIAGSALAQTGLDQLRDSAREASQRVIELRSRQSTLKKELDDLAPRIESLKERRALIASGELKAQLRRSQELSTQLTEVARSLAAAEAESERRNSALLDGLSNELQRIEAAWEQAGSRERREQLSVQLRATKIEREKLRASMPLQAVPSLQPTRIAEEPEDLLRQVDALRDAEDKAKQQLSAVEMRISEVREERALDRRMREFAGEQSLFDDQDRRFRLQADRAQPDRTASGGTQPTGSGSPGTEVSPNPNSTRSAEKPPQVDEAHPMVAQPGDTLRSLESDRDKLRTLVQQLDEKAQQLEQRAKHQR